MAQSPVNDGILCFFSGDLREKDGVKGEASKPKEKPGREQLKGPCLGAHHDTESGAGQPSADRGRYRVSANSVHWTGSNIRTRFVARSRLTSSGFPARHPSLLSGEALGQLADPSKVGPSRPPRLSASVNAFLSTADSPGNVGCSPPIQTFPSLSVHAFYLEAFLPSTASESQLSSFRIPERKPCRSVVWPEN